MNNQQLAEKYSVINSRDDAGSYTLEDLVTRLGDWIDSGDEDGTLDFLDREFLFGAWGHVIGKILEIDFTRDLRGVILQAYKLGKRRGVAEADAVNQKEWDEHDCDCLQG